MYKNPLIKFSIITPTYNSENTLKRCLDSIVNQDYKNFEIVVIDGLSYDETITILSEYRQLYPCITYISEKDNGIYDAMNKGIKLASGDFIYFLGSDDTLYGNMVLSQIASNISNLNEVIYGNVMMRGKNQWNLDNVVFDGEYTIEKFIDRNICHQAIFYPKSVFQKNGDFNTMYITSADFDFNLRCYANTKFTYIDVIIANFFLGGHSTHVEDKEFHKDRGALLMKYFKVKIFHREFINARLYLHRAALSSGSRLNFIERSYCLLAYMTQKFVSMFL